MKKTLSPSMTLKSTETASNSNPNTDMHLSSPLITSTKTPWSPSNKISFSINTPMF